MHTFSYHLDLIRLPAINLAQSPGFVSRARGLTNAHALTTDMARTRGRPSGTNKRQPMRLAGRKTKQLAVMQRLSEPERRASPHWHVVARRARALHHSPPHSPPSTCALCCAAACRSSWRPPQRLESAQQLIEGEPQAPTFHLQCGKAGRCRRRACWAGAPLGEWSACGVWRESWEEGLGRAHLGAREGAAARVHRSASRRPLPPTRRRPPIILLRRRKTCCCRTCFGALPANQLRDERAQLDSCTAPLVCRARIEGRSKGCARLERSGHKTLRRRTLRSDDSFTVNSRPRNGSTQNKRSIE